MDTCENSSCSVSLDLDDCDVEECRCSRPSAIAAGDFDPPCVIHNPDLIIHDKVLPRAFSSLPDELNYRTVQETSAEKGIFALKEISKGAVFGPVVGVLSQVYPDDSVTFAVGSSEWGWMGFDLASNDECNWMKFVRLEENENSNNLLAYQQNRQIYFCAKKNIWPGDELRVWYLASYEEELVKARILQRSEAVVPQKRRLDSTAVSSPAKRKRGRPRKHRDDDSKANSDPDWSGAEDGPIAPLTEIGDDIPCAGEENGEQPVPEKAVARLASSKKATKKPRTRGPKKKQKVPKAKPPPKPVPANPAVKKSHKRRDPVPGEPPRPIKKHTAFPSKCDQCDALFRKDDLLAIHKVCHGAPVPSAQQLICPGCLFNAKTTAELLAHVELHQKPKKPELPFPCPKCPKACLTQRRLDAHDRRVHPAVAARPIECPTCHKMFINQAGFLSHERTHGVEEGRTIRYACAVCQQSFISAVRVQEHAKVHCVDGVFTCRVCQKLYPSYPRLAQHMQTHAERRFTCEICGSTHVTNSRLRRHMETHKETLDHHCDHCGQDFKREGTLKRHIEVVHDPANPSIVRTPFKNRHTSDYENFVYKCVDCRIGFVQRLPYVNHLKNVHPDVKLTSVPELMLPMIEAPSYPCTLCRRRYMTEDALDSHVDKVHPNGERAPFLSELTSLNGGRKTTTMLYLCTRCSNVFISANKLIRHCEERHPGFDPVEEAAASQG